MIEIKMLGGASEVGRSCFLVDTGVEKFLLDCGLNAQEFLRPIDPPMNLDGVFLSHSHLDHSGLIPELYKKGYNKKVYLTQPTLELAGLLLRDAIKVQKRNQREPLFLQHDIESFEHMAEAVDYHKFIEFSKSVAEFRDSGHIPGSASTLIDTGKERLLYTGDMNTSDSLLLKGAHSSYPDIDVLMCESTYSYKNHPHRADLVKNLKDHILNIVENGGIALMPCFSIGRTQELLLAIHDLGLPIFMDGMGIEATRIILDNGKFISDESTLRKAFSKAHKIKSTPERQRATEKPGIIITSGGMLQGGPSHFYIKKLHRREDSAVILTGYQAEGTPGKTLAERGRFISDGLDIEVKMNVQTMDFSAHIGRDNLFKFIEKVNPKKVIPVHGEFIPEFVAELKEKGFDAIEAKNGQTINV